MNLNQEYIYFIDPENMEVLNMLFNKTTLGTATKMGMATDVQNLSFKRFFKKYFEIEF